MNLDIETLVTAYWNNEISKVDLVLSFENLLANAKITYQDYFKSIITAQNAEVLEFVMTLGYQLPESAGFIDFVHQVISEPWHQSYEEMAHYLQSKKNPKSILFLKSAMQKKYEYLELYGTGTRQFINQCGHALWSIGTTEAIAVIRALSQSEDPVLNDEMCYRISRIDGGDYERNYDLD